MAPSTTPSPEDLLLIEGVSVITRRSVGSRDGVGTKAKRRRDTAPDGRSSSGAATPSNGSEQERTADTPLRPLRCPR